jgi:hypothetical protein
MTFTLQPNEAGTMIELEAEAHPTGVRRLLAPVMTPVMRRHIGDLQSASPASSTGEVSPIGRPTVIPPVATDVANREDDVKRSELARRTCRTRQVFAIVRTHRGDCKGARRTRRA